PRHCSRRPCNVAGPPKTCPERPDQRVPASRLTSKIAQFTVQDPIFEQHRTEVTDRMLIFGETAPAAGPGRVCPALQRTATPSQPPTPPAPARPPRRRPLPGTDQAPARSGRPPQRIQAGCVEAQVRPGGRVLEPHKH